MSATQERSLWLWIVAGAFLVFALCGVGAVLVGVLVARKVHTERQQQRAYELFEANRFAEAVDAYRAVSDEDPDDASAKVDLARVLREHGAALLASGDSESARVRLTESRALLERVSAADPDAAEHLVDLAAVHDQFGEAAEGDEDIEAAVAAYTRGLEIRRDLVARTPDDPDTVQNLGWAHAKLGWLSKDLGARERALEHVLEAESLLERGSRALPGSKRAWHNLVWALELHADLESDRGDEDAAHALYERAVAAGRTRLDMGDEETAARDIAYVMQQAAHGFGRRGDWPEASDRWTGSERLRRMLVGADPGNVGVWSDLAWTRERLAVAQGLLERWEEALIARRGAVEARREVTRLEPDESAHRRMLGNALVRLGELEASNGDAEAAQAILAEGRQLLAE